MHYDCDDSILTTGNPVYIIQNSRKSPSTALHLVNVKLFLVDFKSVSWLDCPIVQSLFLRGISHVNRADSRFSPIQWETALQSNAVSHWLGANLELALCQWATHISSILLTPVLTLRMLLAGQHKYVATADLNVRHATYSRQFPHYEGKEIEWGFFIFGGPIVKSSKLKGFDCITTIMFPYIFVSSRYSGLAEAMWI